MPIKAVGWICGQVLKNFFGKNEGIQKVIMDLLDEFKDEFPTILRLSQSTQTHAAYSKPTSKVPNAAACLVLPISHQPVGSAATPSPGFQTHAACSKPTGKVPNAAARSVKHHSLFEIISFPAKTALISIMYASYAALIYLTVGVNTVLEKVKNIFQEEDSIRQNRQETENLRKAFSVPVLPQPTSSEGEIRAKPYRPVLEKLDGTPDHPKLPANKWSNKIQVLHSVFDQSTEKNEHT
ncbi:spermatogenesis-associated protein 9 [Rhynchocyon petersi]